MGLVKRFDRKRFTLGRDLYLKRYAGVMSAVRYLAERNPEFRAKIKSFENDPSLNNDSLLRNRILDEFDEEIKKIRQKKIKFY